MVFGEQRHMAASSRTGYNSSATPRGGFGEGAGFGDGFVGRGG